jgi:hypothetical protein
LVSTINFLIQTLINLIADFLVGFEDDLDSFFSWETTCEVFGGKTLF